MAYVAVVSVLGFAGAITALVGTSWREVEGGILLWPSIFLAIAAVAGEVKPIRLLRAGMEERTLSTSAPFVLALVALAGVGIAIAVQIVASIADDVSHRRALIKSLFNTAQYALSVLSAGVVYALVAGSAFFGLPEPVETRHLGPLLVAGLSMIGVNWLVVAGVLALATRQRLRVVLLEDFRQFFVTLVVLLSVGGIAAIVASDGVGALVLLAPPVVGAHLFAAAAARHAHDATHDSLTGLGNRGQASRDLDRAFGAALSSGSGGPGLLLLDLDHFKDFNDTLGHPVGDQILQETAVRLVGAVPETASVHRLGGDEFAVVVAGDDAEVWQVAHDLLASFDVPFRVETLDLIVRASIGTSIAPGHGTDGDTLMKKADIALYRAKLERDRISTYDPNYDVNSVERLRLLADLRAAPDAGQLHVVYQPQVDLDDRRMLGVEALIRWDHPQRGPLRPDDFIPLAEKSGLINPLTEFVLEEALGQLARWRASGHELRMAINLSARHLGDLALPVRIWQATERHGIPPSMLVLEVTETGILADPDRANVVIRSLRELGVEISIDDYGTGNASLSYLRSLEVDEMKVDRSFIANIASNRHDLIIVRSMIALALALGLRVVAEGIEDEPTTNALRAIGGVIGQGHHLGQPVSAEVIEARLEDERRIREAGNPMDG
jgi:diguanylate cyclase (GGDEF)-like protein